MRISTFTLPNADNNGATLNDVHASLQSTLIDTFGGFTATQTLGGWKSDDGAVYIENGTSYAVAAPDDAATRDRFEFLATFYGKLAEQIAVIVVHGNGAVAFLDCNAIRARVDA